MEKLWFIYSQEEVSGPFTTHDIESFLSRGEFTEAHLIWWKGQKNWITVGEWRTHLSAIMESLHKKPQEAVWFAEQKGAQKGPLSLDQIVDFLKTLESLENTHTWRQGMDRWANLFEIEEIVEKLGLQRRKSPRAPIVGKVLFQRNNQEVEGQISEISSGGFGMAKSQGVELNEIVQVFINSPLLTTTIRATAKVVYITQKGYTGFQFENLHVESKSAIMEYVRQFQERTYTKKTAA